MCLFNYALTPLTEKSLKIYFRGTNKVRAVITEIISSLHPVKSRVSDSVKDERIMHMNQL